MTTLIYLQIPVPEPIPGDPVPVPDPIPRPQPMPDPPPMKNRLNCRIVSVDLRGYAPANFASMTTRIDCDRFFYPEYFASRPTHEP